ncbi:replication-associated recombination protein A [Alicyclobacillus suci]|uniref:replication-associated recombination protein A n=1 Tax=Alicyclobacillus suci TaxID=2816080 RepID=UPI0011BE628F|nr:replication-associated recombination protein A [Alicyclobacillus suci]
MFLFESIKNEPLAYRMRPRTLDEVIGQRHLLAPGRFIHRMVKAKRPVSILLYGPPGTGKTTIANALANTLNLPFAELNAVDAGQKDVEKIVADAKMQGTTILFLDEIHRFNKKQQDYLLPYTESGLITLVAATTANPFHDVNPAVRSRCQILELKSLEPRDIEQGIERALADTERGLGKYAVRLDSEALRHFAEASGGDMRKALNAVEIAVLSTDPAADGTIHITVEIAVECLQKKSLSSDKNGDGHYDLLSAFHKSLRGSDVDAALHYLARLIQSGDLIGLSRRILCVADEDVGLAFPAATSHAIAAIESAERLGFPEAQLPLSKIVMELCLLPKSNSVTTAIGRAMQDVETKHVGEIPVHLKDAHYASAKKLGRGVDYKYPHNYPEGLVEQQYLPDALVGTQYYQPKGLGQEKQFAERYAYIRSGGKAKPKAD